MADRESLISENMGLVHACCRRYTGRGIEYDDLFQAGCLGLIKAVDAFDENRGFKLSTYAVPVIFGELKRLFREGGTVKVGRALKELSLKANRESAKFEVENGRQPTIFELAQILKVEPEQAAEAVSASMPVLSLTLDSDGGEVDGQIDVPVESFDGEVIDILALRQVITELPERDKNLIQLRYFQSKTQSQTAAFLEMTQVQVSRREKAILQRLKKQMLHVE